MTGHDLWLLSPQLAMAGLAALVVVVDMIFRQRRVVLGLAFFGLAAPAAFSLLLWFNPPDETTGS